MSITDYKLYRLLSLLPVLLLLGGCNWGDLSEWQLFDPKGPIAAEQMDIIITSIWVMLIVVIPVTIMGVWFPHKYRQDKTENEYKPHWQHSNVIEAVVWAVPVLIIIALGIITYISSFSLDPRKPIESDKPTMVVQVVAMDWKWLFIYPEYEIATVNEMAMPVDTPVEFLVTSDTVMNSFFIPSLGSQIYAMSGMENRVHLMASEPGVYKGFSANYSGFGFSGMKFSAIATDDAGFEEWVAKVKGSDNVLDDERLAELRVKQKDVPPLHFASVNPLLFSDIIERFTGGITNGQ